MKSNIVSILEILNKVKRLSSVGFSAGYSFNEKKADEYFDDLIQNASSAEFNLPVFSGIIIIEKNSETQYTIVDGLQRIISLSLLLSALCEGSKETLKGTNKKNDDARLKIFTRYLSNSVQTKLELTGEEQEIYRKIIFSQELTKSDKEHNLYKTYKAFLKNISQRKITFTQLFKIISKVQFMIIWAENMPFSTRELYQSMNNSKTDESQINLITSFVSQNCQVGLSTWQRAMYNYKTYGLYDYFNMFIKDFITVQNNGVQPPKNNIYNSFKNYFYRMSQYQPGQKVLENIYKYSQFYLKIIQADFEDFEIQKQITKINENQGQDAYPYLMEVLDDMENGHLEQDSLINILEMVNSFLEARNENPELEINFASLSSDINRMLAIKEIQGTSIADSGEEDEGKISINELNELANSK